MERPSRAELEAAAGDRARGRRADALVPSAATVRTRGSCSSPRILQPAGSFKVRGIYHAVRLLGDEARRAGPQHRQRGQHRQGARLVRAPLRRRRTKPDAGGRAADQGRGRARLGGTPVLVPTAEVFRFLREERVGARALRLRPIPGSTATVISGHGSIGLEILADCPRVESV